MCYLLTQFYFILSIYIALACRVVATVIDFVFAEIFILSFALDEIYRQIAVDHVQIQLLIVTRIYPLVILILLLFL